MDVNQAPCGNTSDYDMGRIYRTEADIRDIKFKILSTLLRWTGNGGEKGITGKWKAYPSAGGYPVRQWKACPIVL